MSLCPEHSICQGLWYRGKEGGVFASALCCKGNPSKCSWVPDEGEAEEVARGPESRSQRRVKWSSLQFI